MPDDDTIDDSDSDSIDYTVYDDARFWTHARLSKIGTTKVQRQNKRRADRVRNQRCTCCTPRDIRDYYRAAHDWGMQVDHVIALANGGLHCLKNMQALSPKQHAVKTGPISAYRTHLSYERTQRMKRYE